MGGAHIWPCRFVMAALRAKPDKSGYTKKRKFRIHEGITTSIIIARENVEVELTTSPAPSPP